MKKFLSLLTVFVLAFALAVPVGATNYGGYDAPDFSGVWDKSNYPYAYLSKIGGSYELTVTSDPLVYSNGIICPSRNITLMQFAVSGGEWFESNDGGAGAGTSLVSTSVFKWSNVNILSEDGDVYYSAPSCDGSSCPATDVNIDGICDDCGMALMSLSRSPVAPDVTGSNKNYVMFYSGTVYQYTVYTSDSSYTIRGEEYGARYRTYLEPSVTATRFQSYDGINWEQTYNDKTSNDYPGEIGWELISSTYDWYTEEGDRFFPVPLWEEVQTVTQGEMGNLTSETAGTMRTLVVCGVGLMACLMALSLFGKRWLLFLR